MFKDVSLMYTVDFLAVLVISNTFFFSTNQSALADVKYKKYISKNIWKKT